MSTIPQLEAILDGIEDIDSPEFKRINDQLNDLYSAAEARRKKREQERLAAELANKIAIAEAKIESLTEEEVDKMFVEAYERYAGDINGLTFEEWYKRSTEYYEIDDQHNVIAKARSANTEEIIPHVSRAHAKHTILKRIKYKLYDHGVRGRDFAYDKESAG